MLTLVETISLAGDRAKQNDDTCGLTGARAWVIDGATDLHAAPLTGAASDASWIAHIANASFYAAPQADLQAAFRHASATARAAFDSIVRGASVERWQRPVASVLMIEEAQNGTIQGADLGDSRLFALGADGKVNVFGGAATGRDDETRAAARQTDSDKPLLQRTNTLEMLRRARASLNGGGGGWTLGTDPTCADHARLWSFEAARPAHLLLMTDGFALLADQYGAYDPAGLVRAALGVGLQELGRELRAIEAQDAGAALHPRFKKSDDATAMLIRLS
ncbi:MAG: hypothetical protein AB7O98_00650 [Hyphomonadaceae bacterium]